MAAEGDTDVNIAGRDNVSITVEGDLWYAPYRGAIPPGHGKTPESLQTTLASLREKLHGQRRDLAWKAVCTGTYNDLDVVASRKTLGVLTAHVESAVSQILEKGGHAEFLGADVEWPSKVIARLKPEFQNVLAIRQMKVQWVDLSEWYQLSRIYYLRLTNVTNTTIKYSLRCIDCSGYTKDAAFELEPNDYQDYGPDNWNWESGERYEVWNTIGTSSVELNGEF